MQGESGVGREVGVAYQVVDDLLGVFGTQSDTGKTTLGDLREGKRTVLVAHAATTDDWFGIQPFIGKADLSDQDKASLCATATSAQAQENALMLVIGYTDSTGSDDLNQTLSEKRAAHVINYLQQSCGWKPYRMLTPTGMAKADPAADNNTPEGKAENRRVAVNILVSKSVDGL